MSFFIDILILSLRFLIAIGDVVIFVAKTLLSLPKKSLSSIKIKYKILDKKEGVRKKPEVTVYKKSRKKKIIFPKIKAPKPYDFSKAVFPLSMPNISIRKKKRGRRKIYRIPLFLKTKYFLIGFLISLIFIVIPVISTTFVKSLPSPRELVSNDIEQTTKIYDRNGTLLFNIFADQDRTLIPLSEIPDDLKNATISIEDKNFYHTPGFDILAIARSIMAFFSGEPLQGGSTITQQLVKARLLTPERTIERKIKEIILAIKTERIYTKEQILEMYLNQVPYGGTAWGIESAAQTYFGKNTKDLTLAESAFLAGLPQAPSIYSPHGQHPTRWKARQREVLKRMVDLGYITENEARKADRETLSFLPPRHILHAPHFVMYIKDLLIERYGISLVEKGGLNVITSLDLEIQNMAENAVKEEVEKSAHLNFTNGAALITDPTSGDILAMVGGKDYFDEKGGNFNVTMALRQPGSTIKVVTYSAALMNGYTAATTIVDSPVRYDSPGAPPYIPVNYSGVFRGPLSLRHALANSVNVTAVKTLNNIGVSTMVDLGKKMGINTWGSFENYGLAITLGSAETRMTDMAVVFGTLANGGERVDLNPILKITDYKGNVFEEKNRISRKRVLPEGIAFIMSNILSDDRARSLEFGTNSLLSIAGHTVAVKTGTSDNKRDNWTIGYTPSYVTAVWVGNNDNSPMHQTLASGISGAAPIWNRIMTNLLKDRPDEKFTPSSDIVVKSCGGREEYFIKGTENLTSCRPIGRSESSQGY